MSDDGFRWYVFFIVATIGFASFLVGAIIGAAQ